MVISLFLLFVIVFTIAWYFICQLRRPRNYPPGPKWLPIVENFNDVKTLNKIHGGLHLAFLQLSKQYNTKVLGLKLTGDYVIAVSTYSLVRTVLTSDAFEGKPDSFFVRTRCLGAIRGIVCTDGSLWAEHRNFVERRFRDAGYGKKGIDFLINKELDEILQVLETQGPDVEFEPIFGSSVLSIVWSLITGIRIRKGDIRLRNLLAVLSKRAKAFDMAGGTLNQFPWLRHIIPDKIGYNLILKLNKQVKEFFMETINEHHDRWEPGKKDNLIYSYITKMKQYEKNQNIFSDEQLVIVFLDLFLGSSQTSGPSISFIILMMLLHPEVQEKAFKDLNESLNTNEPLSYADRTKVPYIEAIILEGFRLYPIAALASPRRAVRESVLNGYTIPEGATVYANIYSVHYEQEYWGDPEVFRPERFLDDQGNIKSSERVLIFGLGKRRCLGELLARQCIFVFLVGILRKYQICPIPNTISPSPKPANGIFLTPQRYKARIIPRSSNNYN